MNAKNQKTTQRNRTTERFPALTVYSGMSGVIDGNLTFAACGFAIATAVNNLGFDWGRAVARDIREDDVAVADRLALFAVASARNAVAATVPQVFDIELLAQGYAASLILLARFAHNPDPETGRRRMDLLESTPSPTQVLTKQFSFVSTTAKQSTAATAASMSAVLGRPIARDPTKVAAVLDADLAAKHTAAQSHVTSLLTHVRTMAAYEKKANGNCPLIDALMEAWVSTRKPEAEVRQSAVNFINTMAERFIAGKWVHIDSGIYILAGLKRPTPTADPLPENA